MQTWAKRGLQTALVTGGLLMLGTGIASAHEDVSPDRPANPLDGSVSIPVQFKDNAIGTPFGQLNMPNVDKKISSDSVTDKLPKPLRGVTDKAMAPVAKATSPVTHALSGVTHKAGAAQHLGVPSDPAAGNRLHGHIAVPVQVAGNAVALLGPAKVHTDATQNFHRPAPVHTGAHGSSLGGNVAGGDADVPIQLANNAIGAGGNASSSGKATQHSSVGGPVTTDGSGSALAGNTALAHLATPLQITGNAVAGGGHAQAASKAESTAAAGGAIKTSGKGGAAAGNAAGAPVALPVELNGNAASAGGIAGSASTAKAGAIAGGTNKDSKGNPFYTLTNGDSAALSGNTAQPELAGPAMFNGNAGSLFGNSASVGKTESKTRAGGGAGTAGRGATLSGNIANSPVAYPAQVFGNGATLGGNASAAHQNKVDAQAGGSNATFGAFRPNGPGSTLSSNDVVPALAGSGDVFGSGASLGGNANGVGQNKDTAKSGGYVGTTGDHSAGSGNIAHAPIALPVECFGLGGTLGGNASGTADNDKTITPGGPPNSEDDGGTAASNIAYLPVSTPVELFGGAAHLGGNSNGLASNKLKSRAGGKAHATGTAGTIAGNIAQGPISAPIQGFGDAAGLIGNGTAAATNTTASKAGGNASTDAKGGSLAGNVVNATGAGAGQIFGDTVGGVGNYNGAGDNDTTSVAGGDVATNGDAGSGSGNVLSGDLLPVAQVFGTGASAVANGNASGNNKTASSVGGDIATSGKAGSLSGNLLDIPAAAIAQGFGVAGAVGGNQTAAGQNNLTGVVGGTRTTSPQVARTLSGIKSVHPISLAPQLYDIPLELVGNALTTASNKTAVDVAGEDAHLIPISGSELPIGQLPTLPNLPAMNKLPLTPQRTVHTQSAAPQAPALNGVLPNLVPGMLKAVPGLNGRGLPMVSGSGVPGLTNAVSLPGMRTVKGGDPLTGVLDVSHLLNVNGGNLLPVQRQLPATQSAGGHIVKGVSARPISARQPSVVSGDLPVLAELPRADKLVDAHNLLNLGGGRFHTLPVNPAMSGLDNAGLTDLFSGQLPTI